MIDVREEEIERAYTLLQSALEHVPLVRRNDARHDVERNEALRSGIFAVHRERDADAMERALRLFALLRDARRVGAFEPVGKGPVMGADAAVGGGHFIVGTGGHAIFFEICQDLSKRRAIAR